VRDLLGHSSVQMSLRCAHLAPDQRRETVAKLNEKPILALTMRLLWNGYQNAASYAFDLMVEREGLEPLDPGIMRAVERKNRLQFQSLAKGCPLPLAPRSTTEHDRSPQSSRRN